MRKRERWFSAYILPHEPALRAWLNKSFPNVEDIDDAIHDAYLRLIKLQKSTEIKTPKALLFRTTRNLLLDYLKSHRVSRKVPYEEEAASFVQDDTDPIPDVVSRNQEREMMRGAIQSLPSQCRQVMTLHGIYGLSQKEIAEQLGISPSQVCNQVAIGLKKCMAHIKRCKQRDLRSK